MRYLFFIFFILIAGSVFAENEGSGPIEFAPDFFERFNEYLGHVKNNPEYKFAFAVHPEGANDFIAHQGGGNALRSAEHEALKNCKAKAGKTGCKIFARESKIVWNWDGIPDFSQGGRDIINWKDVKIMVGKGKISLSNNTTQKYKVYLDTMKTHPKRNDNTFASYFAVSKNGTISGDMDGYGSIDTSMLKALAIAECMTRNNREQCYLYDENTKIIWQE